MEFTLKGSPDEIAEFLSKVLIAEDEEQDDTPTVGFNTED